jgi:hypothetical protein
VASLSLRFSFTVQGYVRLDNLTNEVTVLSKDRDTGYPSNVVFRASITATDGYLKAEIAEMTGYVLAAVTSEDTGTPANSVKVAEKTWTLIGYSVEMKTTTIDSTIRLWMNGDAGQTKELANRYYLDSATA